MNEGRPAGEYEDCMTGFVVDNNSVWGRPAGVAVTREWRAAGERRRQRNDLQGYAQINAALGSGSPTHPECVESACLRRYVVKPMNRLILERRAEALSGGARTAASGDLRFLVGAAVCLARRAPAAR
jgi:hypothetical protein